MADAAATFVSAGPMDLVRMLMPLRRGTGDPCQVHVAGRSEVWQAVRVGSGEPVVARLVQVGEREVTCQAWGAGAGRYLDGVSDLLGARDEPEAFDPLGHALIERLHRAHPWLRIPRTNRVFDALASAVFEQRVTVEEAFAGRRALVRWHGEQPRVRPDSMPAKLRMMPTPSAWSLVPSWDWHRAGVDVHRAAALKRAAKVASRIDECAHLSKLEALRRLRAVPGIGVWTVAETRQRALGDADALSYGDTHLARFIGYALVGEAVDDDGMRELLEPWRGHRFRVVRLLQLGAALGIVRTAPRVRRPRPRPRTHLSF